MEEVIQEKKRFAVLIDSDNISAKYAEIIFNELSEYGLANTRRIYGNWANGNGWNERVLLENSIMPIQQFNYTTGKNSTDMAMVIDAMDILYGGKVDGFCLVTSDSDFTRLAMRLREENKFIIGMGESKTPDSLKKSCNKFIYLDLVAKHNDEEKKEVGKVAAKGTEAKEATPVNLLGSKEKQKTETSKAKESITKLKNIEQAIHDMIAKSSSGKLGMAEIGSKLATLFPDFDVRNYGYTKLTTLINEKFKNLEVEQNGRQYSVTKGDTPSKQEVERKIEEILKEAGGRVNNIAIIHNKLKKEYSGFAAADYGYSKMSSFIKSMKNVRVVDNKVELQTPVKLSDTLKKEKELLNQEIIEMLKVRKEITTSDLNNELRKRHKEFTTATYGFKKMSPFVNSLKGIKLEGSRVILVEENAKN